jgi:hypothetical protein
MRYITFLNEKFIPRIIQADTLTVWKLELDWAESDGATAGEAEANLSTMLFRLVSLESVKKGQNNGIKKGWTQKVEIQNVEVC